MLSKKKRTERFAKANTKKKRKKRPGQKLGHVGMTRPAPDHIDEVIEETLLECPDCHHALGSPSTPVMSNVTFKGIIQTPFQNSYLGGIVAASESSNITQAKVIATLTGSPGVGGIVGYGQFALDRKHLSSKLIIER